MPRTEHAEGKGKADKVFGCRRGPLAARSRVIVIAVCFFVVPNEEPHLQPSSPQPSGRSVQISS